MTIKLGIIGTGIAARDLHLPALERLKDKFEIVCVCNHTEKKAKDFSKLVGGVPYYLSYKDLLANSEVEAVDIVLPIHLNFAVTKDALEAGKHVIVEKPIASNVFDAELMTSFEDRYEQVMMVAENYRYNPVFTRAKAMINDGKIGKPYSVFWDNFNMVDSNNNYGKTQWRIDHQYPGGFITDGGIHQIAVLRDIFGEIDAGVAFTRSVNPHIGKVDSMTFQFTTEGGVNGVFNAYFSANGFNGNRLTVLGEKGTIQVEGKRILLLKRGGKQDAEEKIETDGGYQAEFEDFCDAIMKDKEPVSTFYEAYKDFQTIASALNSAKKWAELALEG